MAAPWNGSIAEGIARLSTGGGGGTSGTDLDDLTDFEIYVDPIALFYKQEELYTAATGYYAVGANTAPTRRPGSSSNISPSQSRPARSITALTDCYYIMSVSLPPRRQAMFRHRPLPNSA